MEIATVVDFLSHEEKKSSNVLGKVAKIPPILLIVLLTTVIFEYSF